MARKFEFKKTYEEIEVGSKTYRMEFNDDKVKEYQDEFLQLKKDYEELMKVDEEEFDNEKDALKHFDEIKEVAKRAIETLLGKDTFDEIYEESGKSIVNVYDLVWYLGEVVNERGSQNREDRRKKYLEQKKNKKKK